jgi:hypothetical protein
MWDLHKILLALSASNKNNFNFFTDRLCGLVVTAPGWNE